jgi:hypothetical protein
MMQLLYSSYSNIRVDWHGSVFPITNTVFHFLIVFLNRRSCCTIAGARRLLKARSHINVSPKPEPEQNFAGESGRLEIIKQELQGILKTISSARRLE